MGIYINPLLSKDPRDKFSLIAAVASDHRASPEELSQNDPLLSHLFSVILLDNGPFLAAGIGYNPTETARFLSADTFVGGWLLTLPQIRTLDPGAADSLLQHIPNFSPDAAPIYPTPPVFKPPRVYLNPSEQIAYEEAHTLVLRTPELLALALFFHQELSYAQPSNFPAPLYLTMAAALYHSKEKFAKLQLLLRDLQSYDDEDKLQEFADDAEIPLPSDNEE